MYNDPETKQTFRNATPISCDIDLQNIIALDLDKNDHYVATPKPVLRGTPRLLEPKQLLSAMIPKNFTAQETRTNSNAEITNFRSVFPFTKHSGTTLRFLGTATSYDFLATSENHPNEFSPSSHRVKFSRHND